MGALDLITSIEARDVNSAWRPAVIAGILQMLIGLWASQQLFSSDRRWEIFGLSREFCDVLRIVSCATEMRRLRLVLAM